MARSESGPAQGVASPRQPELVYRDADLLVLNKPSGLPTTSPDGAGCLASWARKYDRAAPYMHPSSRLDSEVTGLVTFARTQRAIAALNQARKQGRYERLYLALSAKPPEPARGAWHWAIDKDPRNPKRRVALPAGGGRGVQAHSRYAVLFARPEVTLLALHPQTGRTHQLRVHASAAGSPLLGDKHYDGSTRIVLTDGRVVRAPRVMLHCARVVLPAIAAEGVIELVAEVPSDMCEVFVRLGGERARLAREAWSVA